jgi:hypothetical protein
LKSPRNGTGIDMTNLHRSLPLNQSKTDSGIVNESQLMRFGITEAFCQSGTDLVQMGAPAVRQTALQAHQMRFCLHPASLQVLHETASGWPCGLLPLRQR